MFTDLHLINFRNHADLRLQNNSAIVIIVGNNGTGKTNILEAISLFAPGRSMRNCKFDQILKNDQSYMHEWGVHAIYNDTLFSTGYSLHKRRKIMKDNIDLLSQSHILQDIKILWLIPQMENVFIGPSCNRRKLLDRASYNLFPVHANNIIKYDHYLKNRLSILKNENLHHEWLNTLESQLAHIAVDIQKTRNQSLTIFNEHITNIKFPFLKPSIAMKNHQYLDDLNYVTENLKKYRFIDKQNGRSNFGIHKIDINFVHPIKKQSAEYCSTGEQKSMLIAFFIAQAKAIQQHNGILPVMLMDEMLSYLDNQTQQAIMHEIQSLSSQIWITTTEKSKDWDNFNINKTTATWFHI